MTGVGEVLARVVGRAFMDFTLFVGERLEKSTFNFDGLRLNCALPLLPLWCTLSDPLPVPRSVCKAGRGLDATGEWCGFGRGLAAVGEC
jgi:hypothetical protein